MDLSSVDLSRVDLSEVEDLSCVPDRSSVPLLSRSARGTWIFSAEDGSKSGRAETEDKKTYTKVIPTSELPIL